jgi:hypothetical protein
MSGAEAVKAIDWNSVGYGSPIPHLMPATESDDPVEAGFAIQWIDRVLSRYPFSRLAAEIVSIHRDPDDAWAISVEKEWRKNIREADESEAPTISRVFCNAVGCLCYMERDGVTPNGSFSFVGLELKRFGIKQDHWNSTGHYFTANGQRGFWLITVASRPSADARVDTTPISTHSRNRDS